MERRKACYVTVRRDGAERIRKRGISK